MVYPQTISGSESTVARATSPRSPTASSAP